MIPAVAQLVLFAVELAAAVLGKAREVIARSVRVNRPQQQAHYDIVNGYGSLRDQFAGSQLGGNWGGSGANHDCALGTYLNRGFFDDVSDAGLTIKATRFLPSDYSVVDHVATLMVLHWPNVTPDVPDPFVPERWACGGCDFVGPGRGEFTQHVAILIDELYNADASIKAQLHRFTQPTKGPTL